MMPTRTRSGSSWNGMLRRMVNLPLDIMEGMSRAVSHGISLAATGRRDHNLSRRQEGSTEVTGAPATIPDEWVFLSDFEQRYGDLHPCFRACRFMQALKTAEEESKLLFLYLHSSEHPYTYPFCSNTLCSEVVIQFLDANFVCWGASADVGEGLQMRSTLRVPVFPFCAVVAPASDKSIEVLQQVEGPVSPAELVEILQRTMEERGSAFRTSTVNRQLREEQDAAYLASLQKDMKKDQTRDLVIENRAQKPVEPQKKANSSKIRNSSTEKQTNTTQVESVPIHGKSPNITQKKSQTRDLIIENSAQKPVEPQKKANSSKIRNSSTEKQRNTTQVESAPTHGKSPNVTQILIRFPNGERRTQSFACTDKIQSIYNYIDSLDLPGIGSYRLISNFPRKVYGFEQLGMTLKEAGLYPRASLFLELLYNN